jgi:hypothetical protein
LILIGLIPATAAAAAASARPGLSSSAAVIIRPPLVHAHGGLVPPLWPAGCRTIDFWAEQKSFLFKTTIYRFHHVKHWCWGGGIVYAERHSWTFDGSATACLDKVYAPNSWFFTWWYGKANSGHFSEERAHVTNCIFHVGDWKEYYPDVKIWSHADGTYTVSTAN